MNRKKLFFARLILLIITLGVVLAMSFKPSELFGKKLSIHSGIVRGIEKNIEERDVINPQDPVSKKSTTYTYVAKFDLDGTPIIAKFQEPYKIDEGHKLSVSGVQTNEYFEVIAYRNETIQYTGSNSWWLTSLAGIAFAIFAGFIYFRLVQDPQWYEQFVLLGFIGVGIFLVFRGLFIKEALELLSQYR